jgi:hypothetical protein
MAALFRSIPASGCRVTTHGATISQPPIADIAPLTPYILLGAVVRPSPTGAMQMPNTRLFTVGSKRAPQKCTTHGEIAAYRPASSTGPARNTTSRSPISRAYRARSAGRSGGGW